MTCCDISDHSNYSHSDIRWTAIEGKALEDHQSVVLPDIMTMMMTDIAENVTCFCLCQTACVKTRILLYLQFKAKVEDQKGP